MFSEVGGNTKPPTKVVRRGRAVVLGLACLIRSFPGPASTGRFAFWGPCFVGGPPTSAWLLPVAASVSPAGAPKNTRGSPSAWRTLITCWPRSASPLGLDYAVEKTELYVQFQGDLYIAREYATGNNVNSTNNPFPAKSWVGCEIRLKIRC